MAAHFKFDGVRFAPARSGVPIVRNERGFTLTELVVICFLVAVSATFALGITMQFVRQVRGQTGAQQLDAFLKRHREMAIARRRDIEIRFLEPNRVQSAVRAVPNPPAATPAPTVLEEATFEGRVEYRVYPGLPDTPNRFGNGSAIILGGTQPVMFSSEGAFIDAANNPVNATFSLGVRGVRNSATAVTILGTTATIERWRWDGSRWTK